MVYGIILAGGKGERFWPLSRTDMPKQFLRLTSEKMMLEETIERILPLVPKENVRVVTGENMVGVIRNEIPGLPEQCILSEPLGRNTCVAIGLAATHLARIDPHAVLIVLSSDHLIRPTDKLLKILEEGAAVASEGEHLITIGIVPTRPETGYGYIKIGDKFEHAGSHPIFRVAGFAEKPRVAVAKEYYFSGDFLWNSGMFIWSAAAILKAIAECQPELSKLFVEYAGQIGTNSEAEARRQLYRKAISISVDFAVLEKAANVLTMKADIVWDDVGGWTALERYMDRDADNNVRVGETAILDSYEMTVYNDAQGIIACLGVSDLIVVRSGDITMVLHKSRADEIKKMLTVLEENEKTRKYL